MVDVAAVVQRHKIPFFVTAILLTALMASAALRLPAEEALWTPTVLLAIAAAAVWVVIADWALTPFCPRCGAELHGIKTVTERRQTPAGHWLMARVQYACKKCGYRTTRHYHVTKHTPDLHKRQGISRYWRFW